MKIEVLRQGCVDALDTTQEFATGKVILKVKRKLRSDRMALIAGGPVGDVLDIEGEWSLVVFDAQQVLDYIDRNLAQEPNS